MRHTLAQLADVVGLYRPIKRSIRHFTDPVYHRNQVALWQDLTRTTRDVGNWSAQGIERANAESLFAVLSFTNTPIHSKFQCLLCKAMQLRGYRPLIITHSWNRIALEYFRLFGIRHIIFWDQFVEEAVDEQEGWRHVNGLLPQQLTVQQIIPLQFQGIEVGKHALSVTCRRRVEGQLDLKNPDTAGLLRDNIFYAVRSVIAAKKLLRENPIQKMLVRDCGYIPNGSIYETALQANIDCVVYEQGQRRSTWVLKRYTAKTKGDHYFSLSPQSWDRIKMEPWTPEQDRLLEKEFAERYKPDSTDDTRRLQSGKRIKLPEEVRSQLELDASKKTAVIFSHVAWDAAFFFGTCLFDDFEDWLLQTVKFVAAECPQINWIVKLHPFNVFKLQREIRNEESEIRLLRQLMPLPEHIKILRADTDINTQSLFPLVDYALTVNGTVGMEFPCYGVPVVLAGTGRYNGRGFTIDPATKDEYFETLRNLHAIPKLGPNETQLARKHFLALMTRRQISFEEIAPMELKRLHEAQSDVHDNISMRARSLSEFESSGVIRRLGDWLVEGKESDILDSELTGTATEARQ